MLQFCTKISPLNFSKFLNRSVATKAIFKTSPYQLHRLDQGPSPEVTLNREEALILYEKMTTIRKMEAAVNALYKAKIVRGFCHLYSGQEAVAVGVHFNLRKTDFITTTYRNHAWTYLHSCSLDSLIGELVGVRSGAQRGKGGSMHMYSKYFSGGNAIVGAQVPIGTGVALAFKYQNINGVSVVIYGDGASNNGQVYEAFNMAKLWELPCIFLCENNQYSMGTSIPRSTPNPDFYTKGDFIPGFRVDGMDVISVKEAARFAVEHCTIGKGPILMEADTYRYFGHSLSDPGTSYRTRDEIRTVRQERDPIAKFQKKIIAADLASETELKDLDKKAKSAVDKAVEKAKKEKPLPVEQLTYDIYANEVVKKVRGVSPFEKWVHKTSGFAYYPK